MRDLPVTPRYDYPPGYGEVLPIANYTPWEVDAAFQEVYRAVADNTQVDVARCYELWTLLPQTAHLPGTVLEVGVWRGGTGVLLAARAAGLPERGRRGVGDRATGAPRFDVDTHGAVYLADTFQGVVKAGPKDDYYKGGEHADATAAMVSALASSLGLDNVRILEGVFPEDTADRVAEEMVRFCHIDVDVYQSAREVLDWVWPRMPVGGIVVYDDYGFYGCEGVTALGNEDFAKPDRVMIHNLNGHGVLIKTHPDVR
ncbi:MAG: TylF/MycF/NovP-related O-methyltransferase [Spirochaetota bacterium]